MAACRYHDSGAAHFFFNLERLQDLNSGKPGQTDGIGMISVNAGHHGSYPEQRPVRPSPGPYAVNFRPPLFPSSRVVGLVMKDHLDFVQNPLQIYGLISRGQTIQQVPGCHLSGRPPRSVRRVRRSHIPAVRRPQSDADRLRLHTLRHRAEESPGLGRIDIQLFRGHQCQSSRSRRQMYRIDADGAQRRITGEIRHPANRRRRPGGRWRHVSRDAPPNDIVCAFHRQLPVPTPVHDPGEGPASWPIDRPRNDSRLRQYQGPDGFLLYRHGMIALLLMLRNDCSDPDVRLTLDQPSNVNLITAVSPGEIRVGERVIRTSVIIGTRDIIPDWPVASMQRIDETDIAPVLELEPEILLLGSGRQLVFPRQEIYGQVLGRNIGMEVMDTAAACRTFNILAAEGRRVAAALILD